MRIGKEGTLVILYHVTVPATSIPREERFLSA